MKNQSSRHGSCSGRTVGAIVFIVLLLAVGVWFVSDRVGRNDLLQREAKFLSASRRIWNQNASSAVRDLPSYSVNNRSGTVVLINKEVTVDGQKQIAELAWTNSCLGPGVLIVTSSNLFLWREPNGSTRKLNIPNLSRIPIWWYLTDP
ncbi:MAG: hypothetical protein MUF81_16310 [Verrucomicrobia bacterium]|jgi:hypothetical protein|nr:hypothetical protein [Verrucomicrobiota bacterium]